jgi:predicted  nucleic acid-binding Zn-ribbon protein
MGLNLAQIDLLLKDWQHKVSAANQNLLDLSDLPAYQRVTGTGNPPTNLTGITQQRVSKALTAIDRLFEDMELLSDTIDRAKRLRQQLPSLFISDESLQEIHQILTGKSIQLPTIQTPLAKRDLVSSSQQLQSIAPAELLDRMMSTFTIARDTLVAVDSAWEELEAKLITNHQSLIDLQQLAQKLQVQISPALTAAQTNFTNLQTQIDRDPLGVSNTFDRDLAPLINKTSQELTTLSNQRQWLQTEFVTAKQKLVQLRELNQAAMSAQVESQIRIQHNLPMFPQLPPQDLSEISQWLGRLEISFQAGNISAVHVGLTNWLNKMEAYTHTAQAALTANRRPIDLRDELRGRLDALTAKALAKGRAEDPVLADLAVRARQVLFSSPTALNLATDLVHNYEQRLNQQLAC